MKFSLKIIYTALICIINGTSVWGQQQGGELSPANVTVNEYRRLWQNKGTAAALLLDTTLLYSSLYIGQHAYSGDYRRPQQPRSGSDQTIATQGNLKLGDFFVEGGFNYNREKLKDVNFNVSLIDPFRGMPYLVADTNSSDWNNQHYSLNFTVTSPRYYNRWTFGIEGRYKASSGAKQRDIRADNYVYDFYLSPSIMYHRGNHHIGTSFIYQDRKEESSQSLVNVYVNQEYYSLLGLGHAIAALGGGGTYNYENDSRGLGLHYEYSGAVRAIFSGYYKWEAEDVKSSFSSPMAVGTVLRKILSVNTSFLKENDYHMQRLDGSFLRRKMKGIEYVLKRVNQENNNYWDMLSKDVRSIYNTTVGEVKYTYLNKRGMGYKWKFDGGIQYQKTDDLYIIPGSYKKTEAISYQLAAARQLRLSSDKEQELMLGIEAFYRQHLNADYEYKGNFPLYPTVNQLMAEDIAWFKTNAFMLHVPIRYSRRVKKYSKQFVYIQADGRLIKPSGKVFKDRKEYQLTLGVNF